MKKIESIKESGGYLNRYTHMSSSCQCEMTFSVYLPPQSRNAKVPALYWLSGLTCTDDNARTKGGFQRFAARHGIAIVFADTSPRGDAVADAPERYDLGQGAGFYVNATQDPWKPHYRMYDYVTAELPALIEAELPLQAGVRSISGHSMGGHGALICALKQPDAWRSVSAFAPITNPVDCPWGAGCFGAYLGDDRAAWEAYDATCLIRGGARLDDILIDQGDADEFLHEGQLLPSHFQTACETAGQALTLRMQPGYDHSYHFIASFIEDHFEYHAARLK
ncbi:S-formylglutathione hydrolase [Rhabdochromatium marinum]|uniref:S-formylglutathione hydrolase n=1 Tax=Rhabdochromatium marinum TaxID=48729 RepID=UPI001904BB6C|nr:S-formylglutathione hydrolase [Rhabdochromatium marinum]MBK1648391.1 S-formylglutathione hydrolase [Rhabdochromatium marinum]